MSRKISKIVGHNFFLNTFYVSNNLQFCSTMRFGRTTILNRIKKKRNLDVFLP